MDKLLEEFPEYNYRHPVHPWLLSPQYKNSTATLQIEAFHYWWAIQSGKTGKVGLSLHTPNLPFCFCVGYPIQKGMGVEADPLLSDTILQQSPYPLIVVSAVFPHVPCEKKNTKQCDGNEAIIRLQLWGELLTKGGRIIGVLLDDYYAKKNGWSIREKTSATHIWTATQFREQLNMILRDDMFVLEEFDTLKNDFAFNFVLRKEK